LLDYYSGRSETCSPACARERKTAKQRAARASERAQLSLQLDSPPGLAPKTVVEEKRALKTGRTNNGEARSHAREAVRGRAKARSPKPTPARPVPAPPRRTARTSGERARAGKRR